jgi:hypothetical protein
MGMGWAGHTLVCACAGLGCVRHGLGEHGLAWPWSGLGMGLLGMAFAGLGTGWAWPVLGMGG